MEDKAIGYLSGEESLSQPDVVLLTREHFGDPRALRDFLGAVHRGERLLSVAQRLAAVSMVSVAVYLVITVGVVGAAAVATVTGSDVVALLLIFVVRGGFAMVLGVAIAWYVLFRWQRWLDDGRRTQILRWSLARQALITVALLVTYASVPSPQMNPADFSEPVQRLNGSGGPFFSYGMWIASLGWPLLWIWWMDRPPRRTRSVLISLATWVILSTVLFAFAVFSMRHLVDVAMSQGLFPSLEYLLQSPLRFSTGLLTGDIGKAILAGTLYFVFIQVRNRSRHREGVAGSVV